MSRNKDYQHLLNSKRWKQLRQWKLQQNPLCQVCEREGKVSAAVDVHHVKPVAAQTLAEMEALCFNPKNLLSVCIPCHIAIHKEMGKGTKDNHKERANQDLQRWIDRHKKS